MLQQSHQLRRGGFAEPWRLAGLKFLRHDPVNPSLVDAALDADVLEDLRRQERGPFNQLPVHVDDVKCAIGTVGKLDGPKPIVFRGQKLNILVGADGGELDALWLQAGAKHKVVGHFTDENIAAVPGRPSVAAVDRDPRRAGEETGRLPAFIPALHDPLAPQPRSQYSPGLVLADTEQLGVLAIRGDVDCRWRRLEIRIAR